MNTNNNTNNDMNTTTNTTIDTKKLERMIRRVDNALTDLASPATLRRMVNDAHAAGLISDNDAAEVKRIQREIGNSDDTIDACCELQSILQHVQDLENEAAAKRIEEANACSEENAKAFQRIADLDDKKFKRAPRSCAEINRHIKHVNLTIQHERGSGYFYFTDTTTDFQIGESVYVCYLSQQTLGDWVRDAEFARNQGEV